MKTIVPVLASIVLCCLFSVQADADSITMLSVTGGTSRTAIPVGGSQLNAAESQFLGLSFELGSSFSDVAITIPNMSFEFWAGTAWLTDAIGPAATPANVIATTTINPFPGSQGIATTTFLSALNLSAGTYFFVLSSPFCGVADINSPGCGLGLWSGSYANPTIDTTPGVSLFGDEIVGGFACQPASCPANFAFPPASQWTFQPSSNVNEIGFLDVEITGSAVPEPSTLMLLGTGVLALLARGKRRPTLS
jgi:hypothetical protein